MRFALTLTVGYSTEICDMLNHSYVTYLEQLGIEPVLVSNALGNPCSYVDGLGVEGIVLTGGNDISSKLYGQDLIACRNVSDLRDSVEGELLQMAVESKLLVLGICRGMHLVNVFFGGSLIQDIRSEVGGTVNHVRHSHLIRIVDRTVSQLLGVSELVVNSFHNQGITASSLATMLNVFALSKGDGLIEGILHPTLPILGIQWHPERPGSSTEHDVCLIRNFLRRSFWKGPQQL